MNILLVADLHYALKQFDWVLSVAADHDAVVIAGDLLETASVVPLDAQVVVVSEYLRRLAGITRVFVCSGNHDLDAEGPGGERVAGWLAGARWRCRAGRAAPTSRRRRHRARRRG
jgi:predicted MPP superfamily phosphohydrolase